VDELASLALIDPLNRLTIFKSCQKCKSDLIELSPEYIEEKLSIAKQELKKHKHKPTKAHIPAIQQTMHETYTIPGNKVTIGEANINFQWIYLI